MQWCGIPLNQVTWMLHAANVTSDKTQVHDARTRCSNLQEFAEIDLCVFLDVHLSQHVVEQIFGHLLVDLLAMTSHVQQTA